MAASIPAPKCAAIYGIVHIATSRIYVGSTNCLRKRWYEHKTALSNNRHYNSLLQRSWNKHGREAFEFRLLEVVSDFDSILEREQVWIDQLEAATREKGFNLTPTAGSQKGRLVTAETKAKMSLAKRGRTDNSGSNHKLSRLTETDVVEILHALAEGKSGYALAQKHGVTPRVISLIRRGATWKHVEVPASVQEAAIGSSRAKVP